MGHHPARMRNRHSIPIIMAATTQVHGFELMSTSNLCLIVVLQIYTVPHRRTLSLSLSSTICFKLFLIVVTFVAVLCHVCDTVKLLLLLLHCRFKANFVFLSTTFSLSRLPSNIFFNTLYTISIMRIKQYSNSTKNLNGSKDITCPKYFKVLRSEVFSRQERKTRQQILYDQKTKKKKDFRRDVKHFQLGHIKNTFKRISIIH